MFDYKTKTLNYKKRMEQNRFFSRNSYAKKVIGQKYLALLAP
jgi:hypothetical protein